MKRERNHIWLIVAMAALLGCTLAALAHAQAMPDHALTPGAVDGSLTKEKLCDPKFHTGTVRAVTGATKRKVYAEYHRTKSPGVCCEVDHLVSIELGGAETIDNLWPQPYKPVPGAHQKDCLENFLHREVCAGHISLEDAQHQIATDWYAAYRRMTASQQKASVKPR